MDDYTIDILRHAGYDGPERAKEMNDFLRATPQAASLLGQYMDFRRPKFNTGGLVTNDDGSQTYTNDGSGMFYPAGSNTTESGVDPSLTQGLASETAKGPGGFAGDTTSPQYAQQKLNEWQAVLAKNPGDTTAQNRVTGFPPPGTTQ